MNNIGRFAAQIDLLDSLPCEIRYEDLDLISGGAGHKGHHKQSATPTPAGWDRVLNVATPITI